MTSPPAVLLDEGAFAAALRRTIHATRMGADPNETPAGDLPWRRMRRAAQVVGMAASMQSAPIYDVFEHEYDSLVSELPDEFFVYVAYVAVRAAGALTGQLRERFLTRVMAYKEGLIDSLDSINKYAKMVDLEQVWPEAFVGGEIEGWSEAFVDVAAFEVDGIASAGPRGAVEEALEEVCACGIRFDVAIEKLGSPLEAAIAESNEGLRDQYEGDGDWEGDDDAAEQPRHSSYVAEEQEIEDMFDTLR